MGKKIIAKCDLTAYPHTWTKGLDYRLHENKHYITLTSNEGHVHYVNEVKDSIMEKFECVEGEARDSNEIATR